MGNISKPNNFSANTTISSSAVNANFDEIYDEFNGNISAANLAADSVTTAKIADDAITGDKIADSSVGSTQLTTGVCVQQASTMSSAVATGTNIIPYDDTVPQITEGTEFMTVSITPKSATSILEIVCTSFMASSNAIANILTALFKDADANALALGVIRTEVVNTPATGTFSYTMVAGTTSPITFRFRAGTNAASTVTFNGYGGARQFGSTPKSTMIVREYKA